MRKIEISAKCVKKCSHRVKKGTFTSMKCILMYDVIRVAIAERLLLHKVPIIDTCKAASQLQLHEKLMKLSLCMKS